MTDETLLSDPVGIGNQAFFLNNTIFTFNKKMIIREFIKNAVEAEQDVPHKEKTRLIIVNAVNVHFADEDEPTGWFTYAGKKLAIINSGRGMDATQLEHITNFAASSKVMGLGDTENRGEGAKISSLAHNKLGLRYVSRKDGRYYYACIAWDDDQQCFVRLTSRDAKTGLVVSAWQLDPSAFHPEELERYEAFKNADFTEATLMGNAEEDETWCNPYNEPGNHEQQTVPYELFGRCFELEAKAADGSELKLDIKFGSNFRGGGPRLGRSFHTLGEMLRKNTKHFEKIETVDIGDGVTVTFIYAKVDESYRTPYNTYSLGRNGSRIALVSDNEMFDSLEDRSWTNRAADYGLAGLGKAMSVLINLPKGYATQDRTRSELFTKGGAQISVLSYQKSIIEARPKWVTSLVESKFQNADASKSTQEKLQRIAEEMARISRASAGAKATVSSQSLEEGGKGVSTPSSHTGNGKPPQHAHTPSATPAPPRKQRTPGAKTEASVGQNGRTTISVPTIRWITPAEEPSLTGRGAEFSSSMNELRFNLEYDSVQGLIRNLLQDAKILSTATNRPDETRKAITGSVCEHVALAVGTSVVRQLIKSGRDNWTPEDIRDSLKPSALTMVVDMLEYDAGTIKQQFLNTTEWRMLRASGAEAAEAA